MADITGYLSSLLKKISGREIKEPVQEKKEPKIFPLPEHHPRSGYIFANADKGDFRGMALRCAMGDAEGMLWMSDELRKRLSKEFKELEKRHMDDLEDSKCSWANDYLKNHQEDRLFVQGANMWLNRAALYGSKKAENMVQSSLIYQNSLFSKSFMSGQGSGYADCSGAELRRIGLLDFTEEEVYSIEALNEERIYVASFYVDYEGPDETGFGMEDLDNYYFYDEFFRLLFMLKEWSTKDIRINQDRIIPACRKHREEKQAERESYWKRH